MKASCDIMRSILDNVLLTDAGKVEVIKKFVNGEDIEDLFVKRPDCGVVFTDCFCDISNPKEEEDGDEEPQHTSVSRFTNGKIHFVNEQEDVPCMIDMTNDALQVGDWVVIKSFDEIQATTYEVHEFESGWKAYQIEPNNGRQGAMCFNQDMVKYCGQCLKIICKSGSLYDLKTRDGVYVPHTFTIGMFKYAERGI